MLKSLEWCLQEIVLESGLAKDYDQRAGLYYLSLPVNVRSQRTQCNYCPGCCGTSLPFAHCIILLLATTCSDILLSSPPFPPFLSPLPGCTSYYVSLRVGRRYKSWSLRDTGTCKRPLINFLETANSIQLIFCWVSWCLCHPYRDTGWL